MGHQGNTAGRLMQARDVSPLWMGGTMCLQGALAMKEKTKDRWRSLPGVSDQPAGERGDQFPWLSAWEMALRILQPKGFDAHPVTGIEPQLDIVVSTNMLTVGFDEPKIDGLLLKAESQLKHLQKIWLFQAKTRSSSRLPGEELTRRLLRTAEESAGFPCATSWALHALEPVPLAAEPLLLLDGQQRLAALEHITWHTASSGKSATIAFEAMEYLSRRLDEISGAGRTPTSTELARLADAAGALSMLLLDIVQHRLDCSAKHVAYLFTVPLTESSPCGLLRLAAPRVPRAPGAGWKSDPSKFALAA